MGCTNEVTNSTGEEGTRGSPKASRVLMVLIHLETDSFLMGGEALVLTYSNISVELPLKILRCKWGVARPSGL
jgi:hypothetical protein